MNSVWVGASIFSSEVIASVLFPLGLFSVPLVAILTRHQRHMAEIIHGQRHEDLLRAELEGVKAEVSELRSQLRALGQGSQAGGTTEDLTRRLG